MILSKIRVAVFTSLGKDTGINLKYCAFSDSLPVCTLLKMAAEYSGTATRKKKKNPTLTKTEFKASISVHECDVLNTGQMILQVDSEI